VKAAFIVTILAAGLAACAGGVPSPTDTRPETDRTLPPEDRAFGKAFTWEWRKKDAPAEPTAAPATAQPATPAPATGTGKPEDAAKERQEFEEWRAWQEWKRKNQK
jgi:hypothetical protein